VAKIDLDLKGLPSDAELNAMFNAAPKLERFAVADKATRAGGTVIVKRARQLAPKQTGRNRWSKKMYIDGGTGGTPRSANEKPLWKTIKQVVRKYSYNAASVVGPEWHEGNKAYFNTGPDGRRQVLWGKVTGRTVPQIRNWIVQAFDQTEAAQLEAMKKKLKTVLDQYWKSK